MAIKYLEIKSTLDNSDFKKQFISSQEKLVPIIVSFCNTYDDFYKIIKKYRQKDSKIILHPVKGNKENEIKALIGLGLYISFSNNTFNDEKWAQKIVLMTPQNKIIINNEGKFLIDERKVGNAFEEIISKISLMKKNASKDDITRIASYNAVKIFHLRKDLKDKYVYKIRNSLYLNITNRCSNNCDFCPRLEEPVVKGHYLKIKKEPTTEKVIKDIKSFGDLKKFDEIIFCGYGESTTRIDVVKKVAKWLKNKGCKIRINTNGHANLIAKRNVLPELAGLFDVISISLNFHKGNLYNKHCRPIFNNTFDGILEFAKEAKKVCPKVILSVVSGCKDVDVEKCRSIAQKVGVNFRERTYYK